MITNLLFLIISAFLNAINFLFSTLNFVIPDDWINSISVFLAPINYLSGIFPIYTLINALSTVLTVWVAWYTIRIIIKFLLANIPFFSIKGETNLGK